MALAHLRNDKALGRGQMGGDANRVTKRDGALSGDSQLRVPVFTAHKWDVLMENTNENGPCRVDRVRINLVARARFELATFGL